MDDVRANVMKMRDQGASAAEIEAYVRFKSGAQERQPLPSRPRAPMMAAQGSLLRGMTLGLSDYPVAGARKLGGETVELFGGPQARTFDEELQGVRGDTKRYREESPVAAYGTEIIGAVASPPVNALARAAGSVIPGMGLASRLGRYATQGGAIGGVAGLANSQSDAGGIPEAERAAVDTAVGAGFGAGAGVALGGAVEAATPLVRWVSGRIAGRVPSKQPAVAAQVLAKAANRSEMPASRIERKLEQLGPNAVLADTSPNMRAAAEYAAQTPQTLAQAERALGTRANAREVRLQDAVRANVSDQGYGGTIDALNKQAQTKAAPLYDELSQFRLKPDLKLQRFLQDPKVVEGIDRAMKNIRREQLARDLPFDPTDYGVQVQGDKFVVSDPLNMRLWDTAKRGLDEVLEDFRNPLTGRKELTQESRPIQELKDAMIARLDDLTRTGKAEYKLSNGEYTNSLYKRARDAWGGPAQVKDAIERGRDFMKGDYEDFAKAVTRMNDTQREGMRIGVAREMDEMIQKNPTGALKQFQKTFYRQRLSKVFGSRQDANEFYKQMLREAQFAATERQALGNSATLRRAAIKEDMEGTLNELADGAVGITTGRPIFGLPGLMRSAIDWLEKPSPGVQNEIAKMLLSKDPAIKRQAIEAIRQAQHQLAVNSGANLAPRAVAGANVVQSQGGQR